MYSFNFYERLFDQKISFGSKMQPFQDDIFLSKNKQIIFVEEQSDEIQPMVNNQNQYISQFINNHETQVNHKYQNFQLQKNHQIDGQSQSKNNHDQQYEKYQKSKKRQRSFFHNFQKHLVITLRNIIKVKINKQNFSQINQIIAFQMWEIFNNSTIYNKKYLYVLFGVFGENEENEFSKGFLNQLGYMQIFSKYSEDNVRLAQKYLRKLIVAQIQELNLKSYLKVRKLKRIQEFQKYVLQFVEELRNGSIRKRLPKQRKINITL